MSDMQSQLLEAYRGLDREGQRTILTVALAMAGGDWPHTTVMHGVELQAAVAALPAHYHAQAQEAMQ